jgi:hypothetical protein
LEADLRVAILDRLETLMHNPSTYNTLGASKGFQPLAMVVMPA